MAIFADEENVRFVSTPDEFKESITQKFLNRGNRSAREIAEDTGVTIKTLYNWRDQHAKGTPVKKANRSTFEKMKLVIEFASLPEDGRGEFLRSNALFEDDIRSWREGILTGEVEKFTQNLFRKQVEEKDKEIQELKKEVTRKEKALAETAALLVLKKKSPSFFGRGRGMKTT